MTRTLLAFHLREIYSSVRKELLPYSEKPSLIKHQMPFTNNHYPLSSSFLKFSNPSLPNHLTPRIVIVGAGLAGLTCGYRLKQAGITFEIYEASNRIGGRCWTRRNEFDQQQRVEAGGEFIDSDHFAIRQLAQELGFVLDDLLLAERPGTNAFYYVNGQHYTHAEVIKDLKKVWKKLHRDVKAAGYPTLYHRYTKRGWELDHMSILDWINESVPNGVNSKFGKLLEFTYTSEYGAEATDQSSLNLLYLLVMANGPADERYRIRGGNDQIVQKLGKLLSHHITYDTPLIAIKQKNDGRYILTFQSGSSTKDVIADKVVLALPFSILNSTVDFSQAGFQPLKEISIKELGVANNGKIHVQFTDRHWEMLNCNGETFSDTGYQYTYEATRAQTGLPGILSSYFGGNVSMGIRADHPLSSASEFVNQQLEPVLPGISSKWNGKAIVDYWPEYKWTKGSNSYFKIGQYTKFAGVEGEAEGNCHFAGEHTSIDSQGYMNGAVESGERAAKEILRDLNRHS